MSRQIRNRRSLARQSAQAARRPRFSVMELLEGRLLMSTYTVTTNADGGAGSLRQAILDSNANPGADLIQFNLPAGSLTIQPTSALPAVRDTLTIDGTSQPGYAGTPVVELDGELAGAATNGLVLSAPGVTVKGLVINRFNGDGLQLTGGGATVQGNYIGTDVTGTVPMHNHNGIFVTSAGNLIGGTHAGDGNLISGNINDGILIQDIPAASPDPSTVNVIVQGNIIGMDASGSTSLANDGSGIDIGTAQPGHSVSGVLVGGTDPGARNVISANAASGIMVTDSAYVTIQGNFIGADINGRAFDDVDFSSGMPLPDDTGNVANGVLILSGSSFVTVGGTSSAARNLISANDGTGVNIADSNGPSLLVAGNWIGPDGSGINGTGGQSNGVSAGSPTVITGNLINANSGNGILLTDGSSVFGNVIGIGPDGVTPAPNFGFGVQINGSNNQVGGTAAGQGNVIAYNAQAGVGVISGTGNVIRGNAVFSNEMLGIDFNNNGVPILNDANRFHNGPNNNQDFPVLSAVSEVGGSVTFTGSLPVDTNLPAGTAFTLDFYANATADPSGYGQGQVYVGTMTVTTAGGESKIDFTSPAFAAPGELMIFSATATDSAGNTSEFSLDKTAPAAAAVAVNGAPNPATIGSNVTFTATVTGNLAATPTGTVSFFVDGSSTAAATMTLDASGSAAFSTSSLPVGTHTIDAVYSGDSNYPSTDAVTHETVNKAASSTALGSSLNPSTFGQSVTFTATVTGGSTTPSGSVSFFVDGSSTPASVATLAADGTATFTASLGGGSHSVVAVYGGNDSYQSSNASLNQIVNKASTSTSLSSSVNPAALGQDVIFTATVTGGSTTPTGSVSFYVDGSTTPDATATLSATGTASFDTTTLGAGLHSIGAVYGGNTNYAGSNAILNESVTSPHVNGVSTTTLSSSANPSNLGQQVTFTATVTGDQSAVPGGSVSFMDMTAGVSLGTVTLNSSGVATVSTSFAAAGGHTIQATYGGDSNYNGSSATLAQNVNKAASATTLASSANPSTFGTSVTFTATVTGSVMTVAATGTVAFYEGATLLGSATLTSGSASINVSGLLAGAHSITAKYGGDSNYLSGDSLPLTQTVNKALSTTTVKSSANPSVFGQSLTFTATVSGVAGTTPTGTVGFYDNGVLLGTAPLSNGTASVSAAMLAGGTHPVTAKYLGDSNYAASQDAITQTVNQAASSTMLSSSMNPSTLGQSVTFTATVSGLVGATPSGTVSFSDGNTSLGSVALVNGTASITVSSLSVAMHTITATYGGSGNYSSSQNGLTQEVDRASTTTTLTEPTANWTLGQPATFTATVVGGTNAAKPGGIVTFSDGTVTLGQATLNAQGVATFSTSSLGLGSHTITAIYAGDNNFVASQSNPLNPTVTSPGGAISGKSLSDLTGNGISADDSPLGSVVISLYVDRNGNGTLDSADGAAIKVVTSDKNTGVYSFTNLTPATYFVKETTPTGFVQTAPANGTYYTINITAGSQPGETDFDNYHECNNCGTDVSGIYFMINGRKKVTDLRGQVHQGDLVQVYFTVKAGATDTLSLVSYMAPGATFVASQASQQTIYDLASGTFSTGSYSLTVHVPKCYFQVDFVCGLAIDHFGAAGSNIFYSAQGRLISADNGGTTPPPTH